MKLNPPQINLTPAIVVVGIALGLILLYLGVVPFLLGVIFGQYLNNRQRAKKDQPLNHDKS